MKTWVIPVTWEVCGKVSVKANTLQEAMTIARDEAGEVPLPGESDYVDGSWQLSSEDEAYIRCCFNDSQKDEGKS
ncbi:hypothetical protein [Bacteroides acidifaciens]|uniref:hypothetical protein n=1 Tax=Bacteroides acidifaciens TaxID=85831 RepID=UPI002558288F|nr:hypothetical protein [Bacteroides acidifaciens]